MFSKREYTIDLKIATPFSMEEQALLSLYTPQPGTIIQINNHEHFEKVPIEELHSARLIFCHTPRGCTVYKYSGVASRPETAQDFVDKTLTDSEMRLLIEECNKDIRNAVVPWLDKAKQKLKDDIVETEEKLILLNKIARSL